MPHGAETDRVRGRSRSGGPESRFRRVSVRWTRFRQMDDFTFRMRAWNAGSASRDAVTSSSSFPLRAPMPSSTALFTCLVSQGEEERMRCHRPKDLRTARPTTSQAIREDSRLFHVVRRLSPDEGRHVPHVHLPGSRFVEHFHHRRDDRRVRGGRVPETAARLRVRRGGSRERKPRSREPVKTSFFRNPSSVTPIIGYGSRELRFGSRGKPLALFR